MLARANDATLLAARLLLAAALLPTGIARALNVSGFALTLAGAGMPAPNAVATTAVVVQVFGPLAIILGVLPRSPALRWRCSPPRRPACFTPSGSSPARPWWPSGR